MKISSINIVFLSLAQVSASILQGLGKVKVPMYSLLIGATIKIISLIALVNIKSINIYGAEISDILCYGIALVINFVVIHKNIKYNNVFNIAKACLFAAAIGVVAYIGNLLTNSRLSATVSLIIAGGITAILYLFFIALLITAEKRKQIKFAYEKVNKKRN